VKSLDLERPPFSPRFHLLYTEALLRRTCTSLIASIQVRTHPLPLYLPFLLVADGRTSSDTARLVLLFLLFPLFPKAVLRSLPAAAVPLPVRACFSHYLYRPSATNELLSPSSQQQRYVLRTTPPIQPRFKPTLLLSPLHLFHLFYNASHNKVDNVTRKPSSARLSLDSRIPSQRGSAGGGGGANAQGVQGGGKKLNHSASNSSLRSDLSVGSMDDTSYEASMSVMERRLK
jgi:hypothetical protein